MNFPQWTAALNGGMHLSGDTKMNEFTPSEWEINCCEPESMSVGKLNNVVRVLREQLYQQALLKQEVEKAAMDLLVSSKEFIAEVATTAHLQARSHAVWLLNGKKRGA